MVPGVACSLSAYAGRIDTSEGAASPIQQFLANSRPVFLLLSTLPLTMAVLPFITDLRSNLENPPNLAVVTLVRILLFCGMVTMAFSSSERSHRIAISVACLNFAGVSPITSNQKLVPDGSLWPAFETIIYGRFCGDDRGGARYRTLCIGRSVCAVSRDSRAGIDAEAHRSRNRLQHIRRRLAGARSPLRNRTGLDCSRRSRPGSFRGSGRRVWSRRRSHCCRGGIQRTVLRLLRLEAAGPREGH